LPEPNQDNALQLRADHVSKKVTLLAPFILSIEVTNVLWKAIKFKRISQQDAEEALKVLGNLKIDLYDFDWTETSQILKVGCELDCAIYDAAYLFLSLKLNAPFITADNKLYAKAKKHFNILPINQYGVTKS
jgi:predicted nucleic acid-binding protein